MGLENKVPGVEREHRLDRAGRSIGESVLESGYGQA